MFKIGDKVKFQVRGPDGSPHPGAKPPIDVTICGVGSTTYRAYTTGDDWFTSHHENFFVPRRPVVEAPTLDPRCFSKSDQRAIEAARELAEQYAAQADARRVIVGIAGRKRHGKDTAFGALEGFENVKFAAPIKAMARAFFSYVGLSPEMVERLVDGDMKEVPMAFLGDKTSRYFQQVIGTEMGRDLIWDEIWINAAKLRADQFEKVAITDLRFPNEGEAIKSWGGKRVRIVNPRVPVTKGEHPSEDLVDDLEVDAEIINDDTIAVLHQKMQIIMNDGLLATVTLHDGRKVQVCVPDEETKLALESKIG